MPERKDKVQLCPPAIIQYIQAPQVTSLGPFLTLLFLLHPLENSSAHLHFQNIMRIPLLLYPSDLNHHYLLPKIGYKFPSWILCFYPLSREQLKWSSRGPEHRSGHWLFKWLLFSFKINLGKTPFFHPLGPLDRKCGENQDVASLTSTLALLSLLISLGSL